MKPGIRWHSIVSLLIVVCLLSSSVLAFSKKGKDHFDRGMKFEQAEQWEQAAQEFTLALAADPSNADYQLHYRRSLFNASQSFMQQGRALAEQRDYVGAYNAFRQAFGYDPVNQLAVSEMERMLRLKEVLDGNAVSAAGTDGGPRPDLSDNGGVPAAPSTVKPQETVVPARPEQMRTITFSGDLKTWIRKLADELNLNVMFDRQTFAQPRNVDVNLRDVTTAKALDLIFLQEGLFFQKLDRRTILVADQARRQQFQQMVIRTFYLSNMKPSDAQRVITAALPASVGRPQSIVVIDEATNSLSVRDTAENVRLIGEILQSLDKDRAEVVMDVDIYEVSRSSLLQLGNQLGNAGSGTTFPLGGYGGTAVPTGNVFDNATRTGVNLAAITGGVPTAAAAALVIPPSVLTAFQSKNNAKLLASTQIHAFNGEESTARIGQRVPVQTASVYGYTAPTSTTGTGGTTGTGVTNGVFGSNGYPVINYEPTGLTLSFTPQVFPNLDVQVKMKIESKDVSGESTLTPTFTERTISGTARVQNNRTMMLASVSQDVQSTGRQGLPVLGGLPLIGRLFSSPTKNNRQVDIVISVTPRVLRAPAVTPRDLEDRNSGTLQSPTTGSVEAMLRDAERDEQFAARVASRQTPQTRKDLVVPAANPMTYAPASAIATNQNAGDANKTSGSATAQVTAPNVSAQNPPAVLTAANKPANADANESLPQPKSDVPGQPQSVDVASALKNIVSPKTNVAEISLTAKSEPNMTGTVEQLAPKSEKIDITASPNPPATSLTELRITSDNNEIVVGEKRQIAVEFKSEAPLGLAVVTLRFDPHVIKINGVSAGKIFADAKTAPALTQSTDQNGMLLVSLAPAAGSTMRGEGGLLNLDIEALNAGDSGLAFDLANVHLVAADGRSTTLELRPVTLTVKKLEAAPAPKTEAPKTEAPAPKPQPMTDETPTAALRLMPTMLLGATGSLAGAEVQRAKSYVVQKNDNLWSVANQHSVSVAALRKANPSVRGGILTVGSELVIP
jgi:general secretion pathway protein D